MEEEQVDNILSHFGLNRHRAKFMEPPRVRQEINRGPRRPTNSFETIQEDRVRQSRAGPRMPISASMHHAGRNFIGNMYESQQEYNGAMSYESYRTEAEDSPNYREYHEKNPYAIEKQEFTYEDTYQPFDPNSGEINYQGTYNPGAVDGYVTSL